MKNVLKCVKVHSWPWTSCLTNILHSRSTCWNFSGSFKGQLRQTCAHVRPHDSIGGHIITSRNIKVASEHFCHLFVDNIFNDKSANNPLKKPCYHYHILVLFFTVLSHFSQWTEELLCASIIQTIISENNLKCPFKTKWKKDVIVIYRCWTEGSFIHVFVCRREATWCIDITQRSY